MNVAGVYARLDHAAAGVTDGVERGVALAAQYVLGESDAHVPLEEGTLSRSGRVSTDGTKAAVSYDTPYAVYQHEVLTLEHDPGRTAKYLENAFNGAHTVIRDLVATEVRKELDR